MKKLRLLEAVEATSTTWVAPSQRSYSRRFISSVKPRVSPSLPCSSLQQRLQWMSPNLTLPQPFMP